MMRDVLFGLAGLIAMAGPAWAAGEYGVFCADGRIEMRTLEQEKTARGSNVCQFGAFDYLSDAQSFVAKNFGSQGASCACK
jgi:5-hydroxyisourate hydrolase-like protein (transthyretin family)